jgi:hypothetical protein
MPFHLAPPAAVPPPLSMPQPGVAEPCHRFAGPQLLRAPHRDLLPIVARGRQNDVWVCTQVHSLLRHRRQLRIECVVQPDGNEQGDVRTPVASHGCHPERLGGLECAPVVGQSVATVSAPPNLTSRLIIGSRSPVTQCLANGTCPKAPSTSGHRPALFRMTRANAWPARAVAQGPGPLKRALALSRRAVVGVNRSSAVSHSVLKWARATGSSSRRNARWRRA